MHNDGVGPKMRKKIALNTGLLDCIHSINNRKTFCKSTVSIKVLEVAAMML